jgi:uncharacterized protein (DUF697 family)
LAGGAAGIAALAFTVLAPQIYDAIVGLDQFTEAEREAGEAGAKAFSKAKTEFDGFTRIINDSDASFNRQKIALDSANSALSKYGLEIKTLSDYQIAGSEVGNVYAKIKQNEARSSLYAAKAAEEYAKGIALSIAVEQKDVLGAATALSIGDLIKTLFGGATAAVTFAEGIGNAFVEINTNQKKFEQEQDKANQVNEDLIKSLSKIPGVTQKAGKESKIAAKSVKELAKETKAVTVEKLDFFPIGSIAQLNKEIQALRGQQELTFDPAVFQNYQNEIDAISLKIKEIQGGIVFPSIDSEAAGLTNFNATMDAIVAKVDTTKTATQQAVASINSALESIAVNTVVGFAETLGTALGSGDITGGIRRFAGVIGQAVTSLGVQVVAVSKAMIALQAALKKGIFAGPLGLAAGIGLIVAGAALSSLANGGLKLARGGVVASPTPALIGDGGPEAVIPLSQLANIIGGVAMQMGGGGGGNLSIVRGQDIYYSNNNASRSFGRLFG